MTARVHLAGAVQAPDGLLDAFWGYERALMADDLAAMDRLFAPGSQTLRGDPGGLLVGHDEIRAFRSVRGGAPARTLTDVHVHVVDADAAVVVAVTAARSGGIGLQTQLWGRTPTGWVVRTAHVSPPPRTFDPTVWRVVGDPLVPPSAEGLLRGETVAVKDLFAVAGHRVGCGVPAYEAESPVAHESSAAVARLLAAGAAVRGIARTDQFAYSLAGDNPHSGTPPNACVADALPGGSSSGSASAVALGAASVGLGTDTGGSIRVPASYQALWGLRTTHGSVPPDGMVPLAPDFDAIGLLTRSPELLGRAAKALLGAAGSTPLVGRLLALPALPGVDPVVVRATAAFSQVTVDLGPDRLVRYADAFRIHQAHQAWQTHGAWLERHPGAVRGAAAERFAAASAVTAEQDAAATDLLSQARRHIDEVLGDAVLVLPSAATAAPRLWATPAEIDEARSATMRLTALAGIAGRPAVSAPLLSAPTGPVGLCLVGPRGSDLALVELAAALAGRSAGPDDS